MTALRITLQCARLRLLVWRYRATRAAGRAVRRAVGWLFVRTGTKPSQSG